MRVGAGCGWEGSERFVSTSGPLCEEKLLTDCLPIKTVAQPNNNQMTRSSSPPWLGSAMWLGGSRQLFSGAPSAVGSWNPFQQPGPRRACPFPEGRDSCFRLSRRKLNLHSSSPQGAPHNQLLFRPSLDLDPTMQGPGPRGPGLLAHSLISSPSQARPWVCAVF